MVKLKCLFGHDWLYSEVIKVKNTDMWSGEIIMSEKPSKRVCSKCGQEEELVQGVGVLNWMRTK